MIRDPKFLNIRILIFRKKYKMATSAKIICLESVHFGFLAFEADVVIIADGHRSYVITRLNIGKEAFLVLFVLHGRHLRHLTSLVLFH